MLEQAFQRVDTEGAGQLTLPQVTQVLDGLNSLAPDANLALSDQHMKVRGMRLQGRGCGCERVGVCMERERVRRGGLEGCEGVGLEGCGGPAEGGAEGWAGGVEVARRCVCRCSGCRGRRDCGGAGRSPFTPLALLPLPQPLNPCKPTPWPAAGHVRRH